MARGTAGTFLNLTDRNAPQRRAPSPATLYCVTRGIGSASWALSFQEKSHTQYIIGRVSVQEKCWVGLGVRFGEFRNERVGELADQDGSVDRYIRAVSIKYGDEGLDE